MTPDAVADITIRIFEDAAFLFTEPAPGPAAWDAPPVVARLEVSGDHAGRMELRLHPETARRTAEALLLPAPGEAEAAAGPVTAELLNVLAGALADAAYGPDARYRLVPPVLGPFEDELPPEAIRVDLVTLEGEPLSVAFAA